MTDWLSTFRRWPATLDLPVSFQTERAGLLPHIRMDCVGPSVEESSAVSPHLLRFGRKLTTCILHSSTQAERLEAKTICGSLAVSFTVGTGTRKVGMTASIFNPSASPSRIVGA